MTFDETIYISGARRDGATISCSVPARAVEDGVADDVVADVRGNNCEMVTFFVRVLDWPDRLPPQTGDTVRREVSEVSYRVGRVTRLGDCFSISTRSR